MLKKVLWIPDCHIPYEDKRAFELMLKAMESWKPDSINILGDFADFYAVSSHSKDPRRGNKLEEEAEAVNARLDQLDSLGAKEKKYALGNHCDRLDRYLADRAPELSGLVSTEQLFQLRKRGWSVTPYKKSHHQGKIHVTHDTGTAGANAHIKAMEDFQDNVVIGHVHRINVCYAGNAKGSTHVGASFGWLGDISAVDYMHRIKAQRAWHLGFGVGYQESNGTVHLQAVPIIDYKIVLEGRIIKG